MSEAAVIGRHAGETSLPAAGSVLIVDDEAEIRESLETLLELEGYAVESAATGEAGLARIGEQSFDLVLLDLALPDRDGMDLLTEIHLQDFDSSILAEVSGEVPANALADGLWRHARSAKLSHVHVQFREDAASPIFASQRTKAPVPLGLLRDRKDILSVDRNA